MKGLKIGLDIDGPCADFGGHFLKYLKLPRYEPKVWDDPRFVDNFHKIQSDEKFWLSIPSMLDGRELDFIPYIYVTARPISNEVTMKWLKKHHFPNYQSVVTVGHAGSKVKTLKDANIDIYIDDAIHNFEELNNAGIKCLLFTRSHNEDYPELHFNEGGERVDSLIEFQNEYLNTCV